MFYSRLAQHPRHEGIAVRPGPDPVALAMGIAFAAFEYRLDARRFLAVPFGGDARRAAADTGVGRLQVAMHVADAAAAGALRLPDFPAVAAVPRPHHEPVVRGEQAERRRQRGVPELNLQSRPCSRSFAYKAGRSFSPATVLPWSRSSRSARAKSALASAALPSAS